MINVIKWLAVLPYFICSMVLAGTGGLNPVSDSTLQSDVYVVSIGINTYLEPMPQLMNCVADARALAHKITADNEVQQEGQTEIGRQSEIGRVHTWLLLDEAATLANIRKALLEVSRSASSRDYFIFSFTGVGLPEKGTLLPYSDKPLKGMDGNLSDSLLEAKNHT